MKNFIFFTFLLLTSVFSINFTYAACLHTADSYAAEVLINKPGIEYNLDSLKNAQNIILKDNKYILQSQSANNLALILEKQTNPIQGLSVRLQIPIKAEQLNLPYLKIVSEIETENITTSGQGVYNGWSISCVNSIPPTQCEFNKGKTNIIADLVSKKYELTIETRETLDNCNSCDGKCLVVSGTSKCINKPLKEDLESILKYAGLVSSFNDLFIAYRVSGSGNAAVEDLVPAFNADIDWQSIMKAELLNLKREAILAITDEDIEEISKLANQGNAGQNSRIIWGDNAQGKKWDYYYETQFPILTQLENCQEFSLSTIPTGLVSFTGQEIQTYYLIPIVITLTLIFLLVILIVTARIIEKERKKSKLKPITGLRSS